MSKFTCALIALPVEKQSNICLSKGKFYTYDDLPEGETYKGHHLYVTNKNAEIKAGDWVHTTLSGFDLLQVKTVSEDMKGKPALTFTVDVGYLYVDECVKVIATTNPELKVRMFSNGRHYDPSKDCEFYGFKSGIGLHSHLVEVSLPTINTEFLKQWIKKPVSEVEVEFDVVHSDRAKGGFEYFLVKNEDGSIKCNLVEETWKSILSGFINNNNNSTYGLLEFLEKTYEVPKRKTDG